MQTNFFTNLNHVKVSVSLYFTNTERTQKPIRGVLFGRAQQDAPRYQSSFTAHAPRCVAMPQRIRCERTLRQSKDLPKWRSATDDPWSTTRQALDGLAAEERVMLDTPLPEVLARVPRAEVELDRVFVVTLSHT